MKNSLLSLLPAVLLVSAAGPGNAASIPPQDSRNAAPIDGNMHFQMPAFHTLEAWKARALDMRKQILASAGLMPMPAKTPLNAQIFGKLERQGYSVEKVLIETYPGFYLGGNLYRPLGKKGPFPGVVSPHGHWDFGRLENTPTVSIAGRCINLARQGFVVFTYDMVGYNDTDQIPHGDKGPRMGGPREDLWNVSTMGLQLWNSIRSVDFVSSLPDVDPNRLSVTGASGGGTQTFLLTAVDDRIKVSAPVNMLSFIHQGGGCQEAANLRVDLNNVMIGAMMAPRPLLMVSASGDWTRNTPKEEFPAIQSIYKLFDAAGNVEEHQVDAPHNYNRTSRELVYAFFGARILNTAGPVTESAFRIDQVQELLALYNRTRPANAVTMDQYIADRIASAQSDTNQLHPHDLNTLVNARQAFKERLTYAMLATLPGDGELVSEKVGNSSGAESLLIGRASKGDRIPAAWIAPHGSASAIPPTLVVHPEGIAGVLALAKIDGSLVKTLLDRGGAVLTIDAFQTGSAKARQDTTKPGYTVFNRTNDANRVQDILTAIAYLKDRSHETTVNVVGLDRAGIWTLFARSLAGAGVNLIADLDQFNAGDDSEYLKKFFIPGLRRAGDLRAAAVLASEGRLLVHQVSQSFPADWVRDSATASGQPAEILTSKATDAHLVSWLVANPGKSLPAKTGSAR